MLEALHACPKIHSSHRRLNHVTQQPAIATVQTDGVQTTVRPSRQRAWALICNGIFVTATVASAINVIAARKARKGARGGTPIKSELSHLFHRRASSLLRPDVFQQGQTSHYMRLDAVISFLCQSRQSLMMPGAFIKTKLLIKSTEPLSSLPYSLRL